MQKVNDLTLLASCTNPSNVDEVLDSFGIAREDYKQRRYILNEYMGINQVFESSGKEGDLTDEQEYDVEKQLLIMINTRA